MYSEQVSQSDFIVTGQDQGPWAMELTMNQTLCGKGSMDGEL